MLVYPSALSHGFSDLHFTNFQMDFDICVEKLRTNLHGITFNIFCHVVLWRFVYGEN